MSGRRARSKHRRRMKLIYRIALRLSFVLLPLMALWAVLFYLTMVDEINDEADDALEDYSELIIVRMLAGRELPKPNDGSNNSYSIVLVDSGEVARRRQIEYADAEVYIPEKRETEPARVLTTLFRDGAGSCYELKVATPTFEKDDLLQSVLYWVVFLYLLLLLTTITLTVWVFQRSMRPLYALLRWLDGYTPGSRRTPVPSAARVTEFRRLGAALQQAVDRSEALFDRQKQFVGNASHELQTPLAVLGNRLEWLLDNTEPNEAQIGELLKMQRTLRQIVRLNKTLLLLTKIDNGQFPESREIDLAASVREQVALCEEVFSGRGIVCTVLSDAPFWVRMNESLAATLVSNLVKNAYVHSPEGSRVEIVLRDRVLTVSNDGAAPLDGDRIFERFYQGSRKEGSTGLGLALVSAVGRSYGLRIDYRFAAGRHVFTVAWPRP